MYLPNRNVSTLAILAKVIFGLELEGSQDVSLVITDMTMKVYCTNITFNYYFSKYSLTSKFRKCTVQYSTLEEIAFT